MSVSSISTAAASSAIASTLQSAELVVGYLQEGQQNLQALASQIDPTPPPPAPTLDGTGATIDRRV